MTQFEMPQAPEGEYGPVKAWSQPVQIQTYEPLPADKNPMFFEKRVYQGSSGKVYPLPFTDAISREKRLRVWRAFHVENEFLRVMVLPEIGGRVHVALDKLNGYDFFYRQNVIKPALVGLAGPWISGGAEFNWPQHHRPATFMPVSVHIERHSDGSRTIWCSDHDPFNRLKGMHGICLYPDRAYIELKVRLYNRTPLAQTFLWWSNIAVRVHEHYQSFFPTDVHSVADHARRAVSRFPRCDGRYYGVNYGARAREGFPAEQVPPIFRPPGTYPADDLRWYTNIPVPTSYMALGSKEDFHGGYDHARKAGVVLVADHRLAPGKKQWTWGNHSFGYAWDRNLTDDDGPYIELMAGVYTDNQPDFSFLAPGETRSFSQFWYPIRDIGPPIKANVNVALSIRLDGEYLWVGIFATREFPAAKVCLSSAGKILSEWTDDLSPHTVFIRTLSVPTGHEAAGLCVRVEAHDGKQLLEFSPTKTEGTDIPKLAIEPPDPYAIPSSDQLYITGLHLEQYRHATRSPEAYWREALRRDPDDSRCNKALGLWHLRRGEFSAAERHFRQALGRLTSHNENPYDGEPSYHLGLTLRYLSRDEEAYDAFYKSTWNAALRSAAYLALGELDAKQSHWEKALEHLQLSIRSNADNSNARNLAVFVLRKLDRLSEASELLRETRTLDCLDWWARYLEGGVIPENNQALIDVALDYARAGLYRDAIVVLHQFDRLSGDGSVPMAMYVLAYFHEAVGDPSGAMRLQQEAAAASPDYCFPHRLEELQILEAAINRNPNDGRAKYYLGNLLYDRRRHREAISRWESAASIDTAYPTVWRNLGIAYFNVLGDSARARVAFDHALNADPADARILYERDQLWKRIGESPERRLAELQKHHDLVQWRDDLTVELATLYNQTGEPAKALALVLSRRFQPWEGGEGSVVRQYQRAHRTLALEALASGAASKAVSHLNSGLACPESLGEVPHPLSNQSDIHYLLGVAHLAAGEEDAARWSWESVLRIEGDFQEMSVKSFSEMTYYRALALRKLGRAEEAEVVLQSLLAHAEALERKEARIDYFATSLPSMILFEDDLRRRNTVTSLFLQAQAQLALGSPDRALALLSKVFELDPNHAAAAELFPEARQSAAAG